MELELITNELTQFMNNSNHQDDYVMMEESTDRKKLNEKWYCISDAYSLYKYVMGECLI